MVWVLLVLVFMASFSAFEHGHGLRFVIGLAAALVVAALAHFAWTLRRIGRFNIENRQALTAAGRGDHEHAVRVYSTWAARGPTVVSVIARHNLAWTRLRQGRPRQALELLADNEANPSAVKRAGMHASSALDLALGHALIGEIGAAQAWLAEAEQRAPATVSHDTMKAFARAVLDCRDGRHADVARHLDDHWAEYEAVSSGGLFRPLRVIRAFAVAAGGPREAYTADAMLVRPAHPGEFAFLATEWPEMAAFLASHDLGG